MSNAANNPSAQQFEAAKHELAKLPTLGPAIWLFSRDMHRKFTFFADIDWRLMPPLVLNQCKLYFKSEMPWAFVTWAFVNEAVDQRLRSTTPVIAPHEWQCGDKLWLVDVVAPFGDVEDMISQILQEVAPGRNASAWITDAAGLPQLRHFDPNA